MIASMTAFSRQTQETQWGLLTWEIRSVNHRYLELSIKLPDFLRDLEKVTREKIQSRLHRGKVEVYLRFQPGREIPFDLQVNHGLVKTLAKAGHDILGFFPKAEVDVMSVLSWPGVLQTKETNLEAVHQSAMDLLQQTLHDLIACREREGASMAHYMEERLAKIETQLSVISKRLPKVLAAAKEKITTRLAEIAVALDKDRLEQEMVWLTQKTDIAEELQRAQAHVTEVKRVLKQDNAVGRRLDFLMQELNREANTLGSKSIDSEVTQAVIEMKVQIEQMREQVQNIE